MSKLMRRFGRSRTGSTVHAPSADAGKSSRRSSGVRAESAQISMIEPMEQRMMMTVVPGYTETQYAGGGNAVRWISAMDFTANGNIFIASQYDSRYNAGVVHLVKNGVVQSKPVLTLPVSRGYERGLVGVLADKDFATTKKIYVYHTSTGTPGKEYTHNVISTFILNGDVADMSTRKDIFEQEGLGSEYHNGGSMHWGPDGKLYVGVGDNAVRANGQSLNTTKGKVLRLNADGSIPTDNPFYNQTTGINRAIWALGFRNPFTFAFEPGTGKMMINDVGNDAWEEVNAGVKGGNYGWANIEGKRTFQEAPANYQDPVYTYAHPKNADGTNGVSAITGATFWNGKYYFSEYTTGVISELDPATNKVRPFITNVIPPGADLNNSKGVIDMDVGPDGALYYLVNGLNAKVFRVAPTTSAAPGITTQPESRQVAVGAPVTFGVTAFGNGLSYQWQRNQQDIAGATTNAYTINAATLADTNAKFRVIVKNSAGQVISSEATLTVSNDTAPTASIDGPAASLLWVGGTKLAFSGSGTDAEDGNLPDSAFTWSVDYFTGAAQRPLYPETSGIRGDSIDIPSITPYTRDDVFLRITLTVTDSAGISTKVVRDVYPQKANLTVKTNVPGLVFSLDGVERNETVSAAAVAGVQRTIGAAATQVLNGVTYDFVAWSDGGAAEHAFGMPGTDATYTAEYKARTVTTPTANGLTAVYFDNKDLTGKSITRTDPNINFNWGTGSPDPQIGADTYSVRWTGKIAVPTTGTYRFYANVNDAVRLTINGKLLIDKWTDAGNGQYAANIDLQAGQKYDFKMEYYDNTLTSKAQLAWTGPGIAWQPVPKSAFTPATPAVGNPGTTARTLVPWADTYTHDASAGTNYGASDTLQAKVGSTGLNRKAYLKFNIADLASVKTAKLRLFGALNRAATNNAEKNVWVGIYGASTNWTETGVTWSNQPKVSSRVAQGIMIDHNQRWYEFDVAAAVKAAKAAGATEIAFAIQTAPSDVFAVFNSKEAASNTPQLVIT